jgi:hypothetical protein
MAIEKADYDFIKQRRERDFAANDANKSGGRLAILGDCQFHHPSSLQEFKESTNFAQVDTFDIQGNPTYKVDLNEPLPEEFAGRYDWVIDSGTLHCCFDIATVMANIIKMVKMNGKVFHSSNLAGFFGRGFYAVSPSLFYEFYRCNGFEINAMGTRTFANPEPWDLMTPGDSYLLSADDSKVQFTDTDDVDYTPMIPNDSLICCLATKREAVPFTKPVPKHFLKD